MPAEKQLEAVKVEGERVKAPRAAKPTVKTEGEKWNSKRERENEAEKHRAGFLTHANIACEYAVYPDEAPTPDQVMIELAEFTVGRWSELVKALKERVRQSADNAAKRAAGRTADRYFREQSRRLEQNSPEPAGIFAQTFEFRRPS